MNYLIQVINLIKSIWINLDIRYYYVIFLLIFHNIVSINNNLNNLILI